MAYEVTRTYHQQLSSLDVEGVNALLDAMRSEATPIVGAGAPGQDLQESRLAYMRYIGQGHEVGVELPISIEATVVDETSPAAFLAAYEGEYQRLYGRAIPGVDVEILSWVLTVSTGVPAVALQPSAPSTQTKAPSGSRGVMDAESGTVVQAGLFVRTQLSAGDRVEGPAIIVEPNTSTMVTSSFTATIAESGHIIMEARDE